MTILLLFFISGATALIYEVIWSKYLSLLFGSTIQAQTVVLAVFMGGLAIGNKVLGRLADRSRRPLALYGYLEIAVGTWAFCFPTFYNGSDWLFAVVGAGLLEHGLCLLLLKGLLSAALLLCPTILMGGTLPVLAAWLQKSSSAPGQRSARFYSTNTLGAVCGAGLAGFFMVTWVGLPETLQLAAFANILVGVVAVMVSRLQARDTSSVPNTSSSSPQTVASEGGAAIRRACLLVAITGAVSMGLEILASRCLCLIFGASLQSFAIVLVGFILGIGVGSAIIASPRTQNWSKEITTVVLLLGAAAWIGLLVYSIEGLVEVYRVARSGLNSTAMGYRYYQILSGVFSVLLLGVPAALLGSILPLWLKELSEGSGQFAARVGRLLTWNTLGAVGGVLLTGFVFMPSFGLRNSFTLLAFLLTGASLLIAWPARKRRTLIAIGVVGCLLALVSTSGGQQWRLVLSSGVFRWRETEVSPYKVAQRLGLDQMLFYEDAADATVSVQDTGLPGARQRILKVNGKADASTRGDLSTQLLLAHLPMLAKPEAKDVFIFGLGSGISAGALLGYPIDRVCIAENCAPVLRAAKFFEPQNNGVLTNPRVQICREDARTVLKLNPQEYDVIVAEPSNPWTAGVGSVFSREFYQLSASRLKPGGLMAQWFHLYDMNDEIVEMVIRTFATVFPHVEIWDASAGDIIILGSLKAWESDCRVYQRGFTLAGPRRDLAAIGLTTPEAILALQFASQGTAFAIPGPGPIQTDDFPLLEYAAPRAFYIGHRALRLNLFDERTWQAGIASIEKTSSLAALDEDVLKTVFNGIGGSANPDLQAYLSMRCKQKTTTDYTPVGGGVSLRCVFALTNCSPLVAPPSASTNEIARRLFDAELAINSGTEKEAQAVAEIQKILGETRGYDPGTAGWSATYYGSLALQVSLRLHDANKAKQLLQRALELEPNSEVLQYLTRIMAREETLQRAQLAFQTRQ